MTDKSINILNLNIFRGFHTQTDPVYKWEKRRDMLTQMVQSLKPDIILFQECNRLKEDESMEEFMRSLPEYSYCINYSHPDPYRSKALLIAYNPKRFFKMAEVTKWLSYTPDVPSDSWYNPGENYGRIIMGIKFAIVENNNITDKTIWVFNTHFDVNMSAIENSINLVPKILNAILSGNEKYILAGDFNTNTYSLHKTFTAYGMDRLSENLTTNDNHYLKFTFIGKRDAGGSLKRENLMYLDHVFGSGIENSDVYCPYTRDQIVKEYFISDHLPIMINLTL